MKDAVCQQFPRSMLFPIVSSCATLVHVKRERPRESAARTAFIR